MAGVNYFTQSANMIGRVDTDRVPDFCSALRHSIGLEDGDTSIKIVSGMSSSILGPTQIRESSGITLDQLYAYKVVLNRKEAVEYLQYRSVITSAEKFRNQSNNQVYDLLFDRPVTRLESRNVYTYAEIMLLTKQELSFQWPSDLNG